MTAETPYILTTATTCDQFVVKTLTDFDYVCHGSLTLNKFCVSTVYSKWEHYRFDQRH